VNTEHRIPRPTARAAHQVVAGEAVLLHVPKSKLVGLNDTGTFVWRHVDGKRSLCDLAHLVAAEYQVPLETALADVTRLCEKLIERDLIELVAPP
jgi:hypothetical protein